jgi:tetratricopeptide (TPR) repeat protein
MNWSANTFLQDAIQNFKRNNFVDAKILLLKVLDIEPQNFDALNIIGVINGSENNHVEALNFFKKAQRIKPDNNLINFNLAKAFSENENDLEAIRYYKIAIRLNKNHLESWLNLGKSLHQLKRYNEALINYDQAIKLKPDYYKAYNNKGVTLNKLNHYDEALINYDQAIKLKPDYYKAYNNKALIKLCLGDYKEGWSLYKYRWMMNFQGYRHYNFKLLENIVDLKNKKVLVWHEQGFGDTVMFSRYVNQLIDIGAVVTFEVQEDLEPFFRSQFKCIVVNKVSLGEFFDFQVPLLDLPKLFNTSLDNIPFNRFYLKVEYKKKKEWEKKLQLSKNKFNIGISISGNKSYKRNLIRSLPLKKMEPFLDKANLFIIQKELSAEDMKFLNNHKEINFLGKEISNFSDTAAIVENMDLIISVDTSLIHLAGALGKKSFLILSYSADWRWLLDRNSTPWYNSIRIFRQKLIGDWDFVIKQIQLEFNNLNYHKIES